MAEPNSAGFEGRDDGGENLNEMKDRKRLPFAVDDDVAFAIENGYWPDDDDEEDDE